MTGRRPIDGSSAARPAADRAAGAVASRHVTRRIIIATATLVLTIGLSSCAELSTNQVAASVNGAELSRDDLAGMIESQLGQELLQATPDAGFIDANSARGLLSAWAAINSFVQAGVGDDVDRAEVEAALASQYGDVWTAASQPMKELAVSNLVIGQSIQSGAVTTDQLQEIVRAADVTVDSRYGWWNAEQFSVSAFG